ncbi:uncharacterized protein LOC133867263 [Alnus glutinosa]|uniref:uncharacterized protein LOC133867263 n=1 Tax=Alnus glutinosa TaxID=3517 RepID=UPI002D7673B3|nr:uncharacterized protein LOC133867263 [Alnus glutinosa]
MMERTFVLIFVFWAVLTIVTPTLILLSENSKLDLATNGEKREGMKARSMMGYTEKHPAGTTPIALPLTEAPAPAPAPAPTLNPALKARKAILTRFFLRSTDSTGDDHESKVSLRTRPYLI